MSHELHHIIEVKQKDGSWKTFSVLAKPNRWDMPEKKEDDPRFSEEILVPNYEYVTTYLSLRDYYFSHNPWKKNNPFHWGLPDDADEKTKEITKDWVEGGFRMHYCTVAEMNNEAETMFDEWRKEQHKEDILEFSVDFARRLGYGKEGSYPETEDPEDVEMRDDKLWCFRQFLQLSSFAGEMVSAVYNDYIPDRDIRVITWTD